MRNAILVLTLASLLLTGCGTAFIPKAEPETESGERFVIALPQIVLSYNENGAADFEGLPLQAIANSLGIPLSLSSLNIDPVIVNWMHRSNIQHIELRQTGERLLLLVNGKLMPHLLWTDGSLETTSSLIRLLGPDREQLAQLLEKLAPVVRRLGLSVILKFPMQGEAKAIPFAGTDIALTDPKQPEGSAAAIVKFEVKYDEAGVPSIMGISARDIAANGVNLPLVLSPAVIEQAKQGDIQYLQLRSTGDGIYLYLNGKPLPALIWDATMLENTADTAQALYANEPIDWQLVRQLAPVLSNTDVSILLHLPLAAGADPIPVQSH